MCSKQGYFAPERIASLSIMFIQKHVIQAATDPLEHIQSIQKK